MKAVKAWALVWDGRYGMSYDGMASIFFTRKDAMAKAERQIGNPRIVRVQITELKPKASEVTCETERA